MSLGTKDPLETITIQFDFSELIGTNTITSCNVTGTLYQGTDIAPLSIGSQTISGNQVYQNVGGGTQGGIYNMVASGSGAGFGPLLVTGILAVASAVLPGSSIPNP